MLNQVQALVRLHELEFGIDDNARLQPERTQMEIERCRSELPRSLLARYEQLKMRYSVGAVVEVENDICSGCRISLPKSLADRLKRGMVFCDHCGRILYHPDLVYNLQH